MDQQADQDTGLKPLADAPEFHKLPLKVLLRELESSQVGLSTPEASRRLAADGPNELRVRQEVPEIVKFLRQFKNFFALLLIVGGLLASFAEYLDPDQGNLYIAIALFAVVLLNAAFTYFQEHQSEQIMESFKMMLPAMVTTLRDGKTREIEARDLVPGDVIILREGDRVPADGRLLEAHEFKVDQASLTGESEPQLLDPSASADNVLESTNTWCSPAPSFRTVKARPSCARPAWTHKSAASWN